MLISHRYVPGQTDYLTEVDSSVLEARIHAIREEINDTKKARSARYIKRIRAELRYINWELNQRELELTELRKLEDSIWAEA